eukprot:scaffold3011_cov64-Cyclotella_meneghiniana.AAC.1
MYEDIYIQERLYNYTLYRSGSGNSIRGTKVFSPRTSIGSSLNTKQHLENDCRYSMRIHGSTINESETSAALLQSSTAKERNLVQVKTTVGVHPYHRLKSESPDGT